MIEGSGSGSGSIPLINGSGSGRPKNMWIRWIWIRIRIRNTGRNGSQSTPTEDWNSHIHTFSSPWGLTWSQASNPCIVGRLTWTMSALRTSLNTNAAIMHSELIAERISKASECLPYFHFINKILNTNKICYITTYYLFHFKPYDLYS